MTPTQTFWTFWIVLAFITALGGFLLLSLVAGLKGNAAWSLADAISEEAGDQPNPLPPGVKPIMVASSSRLIAFLGLSVILCLYLGFGYVYLWERFFRPSAMMDSKNLLAFLFGGATMFAPYMANQLSSAFSTYTAPQPPPPAPVPPAPHAQVPPG